MNLIVNSVGDASCASLKSIVNFKQFVENRKQFEMFKLNKNEILIFEPKKFISILTMDYGKCTSNTHRLVNESNDFLLTHFHLDHYDGFRVGFNIYNRKYSFDNFYYQKLPRIDDSLIDCESNTVHNNDDNKGISLIEKKLAFLIVFNNILSSYIESSNINRDILDVFNIFDYVENDNINSTCNYKFVPVGKGNNIELGEERFNVIWSPESLDNKEIKEINDTYNELSNINNCISKEFDEFCESIVDYQNKKEADDKNNIESIKTNHSKIDLLMSAKSYFKELESENLESQRKENLLQFLKNNTKVVEKIKKKTTSIANDLSVCIANSELLSLGDLNKNINKCINGYKKKIRTNFIDVKYLITAHHGTHWDKSCQNIKADYVISSNGRTRFEDFENKYLYSLKDEFINSVDIKTRLHNTFVDGDFMTR